MRTVGVDLTTEVAHKLFSDHVPHDSIKAGALFKLAKITNSWTTSDWASIRRWLPFLSELLDQSGGRIPHSASFLEQFTSWLRQRGFDWAEKDTLRPVTNIRIMLRAMQERARKPHPSPPVHYTNPD